MQVKLNTYHWGIQWNSTVMQVKKATFLSGGKGRTENRRDVSSGQSAPPDVYFHGKYIKKSAADRQSDDTSVPGDTAQCCSVSDISI
jgi:hypothetical protein